MTSVTPQAISVSVSVSVDSLHLFAIGTAGFLTPKM